MPLVRDTTAKSRYIAQQAAALNKLGGACPLTQCFLFDLQTGYSGPAQQLKATSLQAGG